MVHNIYSL